MKNENKNENILPAIMSFFIPGLGQLMKKDWGKGVAMLVGYGMSIVLFWLLIWILIGIIFIPIGIGIWIWSIVDAYSS